MNDHAIASQVAVVETNVFGVLAYYAWCLTCRTRVCDHPAHNGETTAVRHASEHRCAGGEED